MYTVYKLYFCKQKVISTNESSIRILSLKDFVFNYKVVFEMLIHYILKEKN